MPTYEYKCDNCGHTMEVYQSIKDKPLRKCPKCGKSSLKRLMGAGAALIFKGSGFYCTDYRKSSSGGGASSSSKAESKTESTDSSSTSKDSSSSAKDTGGTSKASSKDSGDTSRASGGGKKKD
jgi:putative FmdB family regulatory protein